MILQSDIQHQTIDLSPALGAPALARCIFNEDRVSCATGYGHSIRVRAMGEACERIFSFSSPKSLGAAGADALFQPTRPWFDVLLKTNPGRLLDMVAVTDLTTGQATLMPAILATLATHLDDEALPRRDSSGSAVHQTRARALKAAVMEFSERQSLTAFWYYGHVNSSWRVHANTQGVSAETRSILQLLSGWGAVHLAEISLFQGIKVILAVLRGHRSPVWFGAGGSGAPNLQHALEKAIQELYQAVILTYQIATDTVSPENEVALTQGYMTFNTSDAATEVVSAMTANDCNNVQVTLSSAPLLHYSDTINLTARRAELYLSVLHGVRAFPTMTHHETEAEVLAAERYGLPLQPIRKGAVPFA